MSPGPQFDAYVRVDWSRRVRRRREHLGLSQTEAAAKGKLHQGQWSKVESTLGPITDETKWRVSASLECPIGELFPWPESRPVLRDEPVPAVVITGGDIVEVAS